MSLEVMETLPGFRFSPTEYELVGTYLRRMCEERDFLGRNLIATVDLYKHDPWELPELATKRPYMNEREWYFFVPRHHKYPNGSRPNRVTKSGYWKATGTDKPVGNKEGSECIGLRKTLVFYQGKAPKGEKTSWIMNEYRLPDNMSTRLHQNDVALCKIYRKGCNRSNYNYGSYTPNSNSPEEEQKTDEDKSPGLSQINIINDGTTRLTSTTQSTLTQTDQQQAQGITTTENLAPENIMFSGYDDIEQDNSFRWEYSIHEEFPWNDICKRMMSGQHSLF